MKEREYNVLDIFCGTGSFAHGFINHSNQFKLVAAIDILQVATDTVKLNNPSCHVITKDIRKVDPEELHKSLNKVPIDIIVGGPPCQGFSSIRPNRSNKKSDSRNNLFQEFARFVEYFNPTCFVLENVVGILTHKGGNTLNRLQKSFEDLGYYTDWRILNAANYGVPQKRERFILMGSKNKALLSFPSPTHYFSGRSIGYSDRERIVVSSEKKIKAITLYEAISDLPEIKSGESSSAYKHSPRNEFQRKARNGCKKLTLHEASNHAEKMLEI
ncbi:MAG: DNA cytosine methyltransferase, partial [Alphaproteobacteria bacterium]|nr:DNA cytosine methyltransferase [Alphaproteobacteria bacterium]